MEQHKLKELFESPFRVVYVKLSLLNRDGDIIEEIQGRATGGSINLDGASSVRRSCNISLVSENVNISDYQWALHTLFEVKIGLRGLDGETIEWFPQGVYLINSFNCSLNVNSYNINISGQDKMCQLNGEISGALTAETDFGEYEEVDSKGNVINKKKLTLREIIWNVVHTYAQEPVSNIQIELPDDSGINLIEYRGDNPLYILRDNEDDSIKNITIYGSQKGDTKRLDELSQYWQQGTILDNTPIKGEVFEIDTQSYQVQKAEYGDTIGYEKTELTYAGKLIAAAGEAVTSILDKIRDMLGEYEYFYDIRGKFVFQKKKTYLKTIWNNSDIIEIYENGEYSYSFSDLSLFTSFANTPNLKQLKNDYTVWGTRKSITGDELPIHMRLAIDRKPREYVSPWQQENGEFKRYSIENYDWRELIYQMAWDYYKHNQEPSFELLLTAANSSWVVGGRTGYEQYYTDLLGFWRELYNPNAAEEQEYVKVSYNSSVKKYRHGWMLKGELVDIPYYSWYIDKSGTRIKWTDSVDLWNGEDEYSLRNAYLKQGENYIPFMKTSFAPKVYRFKNASGEFVTLESLVNEENDYGLKKNIHNLYYKSKNGYIKLAQQKDATKVKDLDVVFRNRLCSQMYILKNNSETREVVTAFGTDSGDYWIQKNFTHNNFKSIYDDSSLSFYYSVDPEILNDELTPDEWNKTKILFDFKTDHLYVDEIIWPEEEEQEWYILENNQYKLYVDYLAADGKLDESKLCLPQPKEGGTLPLSLLEQRQINRDDLYLKIEEKKEVEGSDETHTVVEYKNFFEACVKAKKYLPEGPIYYLDLESEPQEANGEVPQFETYYATNLYGELEKGIEYKRPITYYSRVSDYYIDEDSQYNNWNKKVVESPESLNFWFDFIDPESVSTMRPFEVQKIGSRPIVKQEKGVKAIYYPEVSDLYFGEIFQLPKAMEKYFTISTRGQSAFDTINNYLYNHTYITESVTINSIPIYGLEPNTKILINDSEHGVEGEYIVDKLTIPLNYNGMMTINATKAPEIY